LENSLPYPPDVRLGEFKRRFLPILGIEADSSAPQPETVATLAEISRLTVEVLEGLACVGPVSFCVQFVFGQVI
jgi:hypothetical protein